MTRFITRAGFAIAVTGVMTFALGSLGDASAGRTDGHNPSCECLGFEGSYKVEDPSGTYTVDRDGLVLTFTVGTYPDVGSPNTDNAVLSVTVDPSSAVTAGSIVVKGGNDAIVHAFDASAPLHAPTLRNGKWPTISHVQICWNPPPEPELGRVEVTKVVAGDEVPESVFEICLTGPAPGAAVRCLSVDGAGVVAFEDLEPGVYVLSETYPGVGFSVGYSAEEVTVVAGATATATITNTYEVPEPELGRVEVTKVVAGEPPMLSYEICLTGPVPDGATQCVLVSGAGVVSFEDLEPGVYELSETYPGTGFSVSYSAEEVTVVAGETATATITNTYVESLTPTTTTPPTTTPPTSTIAGGGDTLPSTGADARLMVVAAAMVMTGAVLMLLGRRSGRPVAHTG